MSRLIQGYFLLDKVIDIEMTFILGSLRFASRKASKTTYSRHLKCFFNFCVKAGYHTDNPVPARPRSKGKTKRTVEFLSRDEYQQLIQCIEADQPDQLRGNLFWLLRPIKFAVHTGVRLGELCHIRWEAIDLEKGYVHIKNTETFRTKSGAERSIYLAGAARKVIVDLKAEKGSCPYVFTGAKGEQLNGQFLSKKFREYRKKAGLPEGIHFHSLRHTFASWAAMGGMDLFKLKEILGHSDIQMTMIYAHLRPEAQKEDMEHLRLTPFLR